MIRTSFSRCLVDPTSFFASIRTATSRYRSKLTRTAILRCLLDHTSASAETRTATSRRRSKLRRLCRWDDCCISRISQPLHALLPRGIDQSYCDFVVEMTSTFHGQSSWRTRCYLTVSAKIPRPLFSRWILYPTRISSGIRTITLRHWQRMLRSVPRDEYYIPLTGWWQWRCYRLLQPEGMKLLSLEQHSMTLSGNTLWHDTRAEGNTTKRKDY